MNYYNLNNIHVLKPTFVEYLKELTHYYLKEESLPHGLKTCNSNYKQKPFMIINSRCANKHFLCINEKVKNYDKIVEEINQILELHIKKIQLSKSMIDEYY